MLSFKQYLREEKDPDIIMVWSQKGYDLEKTTKDFITLRKDNVFIDHILKNRNLPFNLKNKGMPKTALYVSNLDIISLEGCPQEVNYFTCNSNHSLTSLKGAPLKVHGTVRASDCENITKPMIVLS